MATSPNPQADDTVCETEDHDPESHIGELLTEGDESDDVDITGLVR